MKAHRRFLFLLHSDRRFEARLRDAAGRDYRVEAVASWAALLEALQVSSPAALVVVDPYFASPSRDLAPSLEALLRAFPSIVVVAALEVRLNAYGDLRTLGQWGIAEVISLGEDNVAALSRLLYSLRGRQVSAVVQRALPLSVSARARSIVQAAGNTASLGGQATDLARELHVSMRTLLRWCERSGLPPPRQLLAWMRILLAAELMDDPGRSVESVAMACGYAADSGLRRSLRTLLGTNPRTLRKYGAFATAAEAFGSALDCARRVSLAAG
jgi:AraC-like DNA-binding protein